MTKDQKHGFTLAELAIVVLIIGLIIGAVLMGKNFLRNAEIRAMTAEFASYTQAINNFRDKYQALPGDFAGASTIWSGITNGDGDGLITGNTAGTRLDEQFLAWQHLSKAEMISGTFTGAAGSAGARDKIPGTNIPKSRRTQSGWGLISITLTDIANGYSEIPYTAPDLAPNHVLWFGSNSVSGTTDSQVPLLAPLEANEVDIKIDDGKPGTGKVVAQANGSNGTCSTSDTAYNIAASGMLCSLVFKTGF